MIAFLVYLLVLLVSLAGVALNVFSLPGNWVMMLAAAVLAWRTGWSRPPLGVLGGMVLILLLGEAIELTGSVVGAQTFGASRAASWAAIAGAIVGALIGMPVWIVGNILGAILGAFLAAWIVELIRRRGLKAATRAAVGAALGRTIGLGAKISCGLLAWALLTWAAWP